MSLIYNGIAFCYPQTEVHVMGPGFDPSGTDQLYTTIRLRVRSLLYVNSLTGQGILPAEFGTDFSSGQLLARIRHMLTQPRAPLYYDFLSLPGQTGGGAPFTPAAPIIDLPDGRDDANGPIPDQDAFSVTYTTPDCLEVTWACTVKLIDCGFGPGDTPLSLRWEDSISWDKYWKATYQRVGTAIISSRSTVKIDDLRRNKIAPVVAPQFQRTAARYTISRDGLRCDFSFTDEQMRFAPPYPAVDMEIVQSETLPYLNGMRSGEVSVTMTGIQSADVRQMLMWALVIIRSRVWASNPLQTSKGVVVGGPGQAPPVIRTRETTNGVDVAVTAPYKVAPRKKQQQQVAGGNSFWGGFAAAAVGGPTGSFTGLGPLGGSASPTAEGRDPTKTPFLPWVGYGTSPLSPNNPVGFATWANVTGQIQGPADGVGLAPSLALFAALLQDPCGAALESNPNATTTTVDLRTNPNTFNTIISGQGGASPVKDAQLSVSLSTLNMSQYQSEVPVSADDTSLYDFDEQPGVYDFWQCASEYHTDPGTIVLPTCNPDGTNIKVRHSSKMITLRKRWAASRTGSTPTLPPEDIGDDNWVFTGGMKTPRELRVAPDGVSVIYEVNGVYEYQALDASKVDMEAEIPPFLSTADLRLQKGWVDGAFLTGGGGGGGTQLSGGSGPLGGNTLPVIFPN